MLVTTLSSPARDGVAESVLVVVYQGAAIDCQGAAVDHPSGATNRQGPPSTAGHQDVATDCWSPRCPH
jgi:hypothetical protein